MCVSWGDRNRGTGCVLQVVLGLDDEAPTSPDDAGTGQGKVLGEGELLGGTSKVGDAGEDESPLQRIESVIVYIVE